MGATLTCPCGRSFEATASPAEAGGVVSAVCPSCGSPVPLAAAHDPAAEQTRFMADPASTPRDPRPVAAAAAAAAAAGPLPLMSGRGEPSRDAGAATVLPQFPGLEVLEEVAPGVGGMGVVYKAREPALDRIVAVKTTKAHLGTPEGRAFFLNEARAAAKLDHPGILRILRFVPEHTPPFYVMQYVDGRPLDRACKGRPFAFVAEVVEKVARALAYAHSQGIVHRDIKADNIIVDAEGEPHVADFGLAGRCDVGVERDGQGAAAVARPGPGPTPNQVVGTASHIAPELYQGRPATPLVDVYALGVTLYHLLAGRLPFGGRTLAEVREAALTCDPPLPLELNPAVPEPLQRICLKAMERDPAERYDSAQMMADELRRFREGRDVAARPTRYAKELAGKFRNHLTDIRIWHEQNLIDVREMDRLSRPYRAILDAASPYHSLSRLFPWESILLRLGGWLVLMGSFLWPTFYWGALGAGWKRILALAVPAAAINAMGWLLRRSGSRVNALVFLSTGAILVGVLVAVVLGEWRLLEFQQGVEQELFDPNYRGQSLSPTNAQLTVAAAVFTAYCALLIVAEPVPLVAFWLSTGVAGVVSGFLMLAGLRLWVLFEQHVARALLCYALLAAAFAAASFALARWPRTRPFSATVYAFFPVPFAFCFSAMAYYAAAEWFGATHAWDDLTANRWLTAAGMLYFAAALASARSSLSHVRFWGSFFMLLVPVHLLIPTQVLYDRAPLFQLGREPVTAFELASAAIALGLMVVGTRLRQHALGLPALAGAILFVYRATDRHFSENLAWPLTLVVLGGVAMTLGRRSLARRAQGRPDAAARL